MKEIELRKYHMDLDITLRDSRFCNISDSDFSNKIKIFSNIFHDTNNPGDPLQWPSMTCKMHGSFLSPSIALRFSLIIPVATASTEWSFPNGK